MYDLIIVGGGPAGVAAGVYAARKKIKSLLITDSFGGQSLVSADVQNWIGVVSASGYDLARMMETHLRAQEGIEIIDSDIVTGIEKKQDSFSVTTKEGKKLESQTILLASGSRRRKLGVPGEKEFDGKGVAYCSTCDAPIFKDKDVAVVGGGNAGLEAVVDLLPYAKKIYLLEYADALRGDPITQEKVRKSAKVQIITMAKTLAVLGDKMVTGLRYEDRATSKVKELPLEGVFVEIGALPNSEMVKDFVKLNQFGEVIVDHKTQRTSCDGVWAAGDVSDVLFKQNNVSMGDAVKAVLDIYQYLNEKSR